MAEATALKAVQCRFDSDPWYPSPHRPRQRCIGLDGGASLRVGSRAWQDDYLPSVVGARPVEARHQKRKRARFNHSFSGATESETREMGSRTKAARRAAHLPQEPTRPPMGPWKQCEPFLDEDGAHEVFQNNIYTVMRRYFKSHTGEEMVHLSIRRNDRLAISDWRDKQYIKDTLVGEECEAFELYPAQRRMVDTANQYHLWCYADPQITIPVGWTTRVVSEIGPTALTPKARQRPFEEDQRPGDLLGEEYLERLISERAQRLRGG